MTDRRRHRRWGFALGILLALGTGMIAGPALAQSLNLDLGEGGGSSTARIIQMIALLTVLSLAPSILIMTTSFTRIVIVLSFLRSAMGVQQVPPNTVMISLALFLTFFIMAPVFEQSYQQGILPLINEDIDEMEAFQRTAAPLKTFMLGHTRERDLMLFADMAKLKEVKGPQQLPLQVVIPAFMISEIKRAFEIGFLLFLPFLIIDMVVASILMSMGMMMLPPAMVALPFKVIFFVLVDGWYLISGSLVKSFGTVQ
ncbi:MAG TPA: flagellar type III secretion system pore protein FliP [Azospirillaceae bacterium]|nr:flagellar type III secretion system pore protein FliP [Azospirillaceae bacterium]